MDYVFLAFSNSHQVPLPHLREEDETIYRLFLQRQLKGHVHIHRDSYATRENLVSHLSELKDDLILFHFSGHAGAHKILLEDQETHGRGIATLLGQCPKLKLIVLNGCSTSDQVKQLQEIKSHPVIIATHSPIGDQKASEFSKEFYQEMLGRLNSISNSFTAGLGAAQTMSPNIIEVRSESHAGDLTRDSWGLFASNDIDLEWRFPVTPMDPKPPGDFSINKYLIDELIRSFAPYSENCRKIFSAESADIEVTYSNKKIAILECLPHPVSQQLRKLIVKSDTDSSLVFYDKPGVNRLSQLHMTFQTMIELIGFASLAELWDFLNEHEPTVPENLTTSIAHLFTSKRTRLSSAGLLDIIEKSIEFLTTARYKPFIENMNQLSEVSLRHIRDLCHYFDAVDTQIQDPEELSQNIINQHCIDAEKNLAELFDELAFIINYTVISVKDIGVINYKHFKKPIFKHRVIKLVQTFVGLETEEEAHETFLDNSSVLLMNEDSKGGTRYLNLSPFIFDENAFENRQSDEAKLRFFQYYLPDRDTFCFKHVYKPHEAVLMVDDAKLQPIKRQISAFATSLFKKPVQELYE